MGSSAEEEYASFEEKVKRTVYLDNLSPQVTESVLKTALDQFATVKSIKFIPNYLEPKIAAQCALVELDSVKKAKEVILMIVQYPFMISGMPRPVRARPAEVEMFDDRPRKPGRKLTCRWLEPNDPDFEVAQEIKQLTCKHAAEAALLLKHQLQEEEKLATQQSETLKGHYKKYKLIDSIMADGTAQRLARQYNLRVADD
ncbi:RNA-binding family protein isoform 1 [Senna tora]|uniref:RNA-binding family protein isoform 1 n=1 Tax=Senna tora TaxID=362788 RepID=A0A834TUY4_9FABA|nr:RNA-binding family protein isoform 1 [Senna tora]